jgi:hypothetical protein
MKIKNALLVCLAIVVFGACKKKKDEPDLEGPKVSNVVIDGVTYPINSNVTFKAGDTLDFSVTFTDDFGLKHIDLSQAHAGVAYSACGYDTIFFSQDLSGTSQTINFTYKVPLFMDMNQKNCITFYLEDSDNDEEGPKKVAYLITILVKPEAKPYNFTYPNARVYNYQSTNNIQCWNIYSNTAKDKDDATNNYQLYNNTMVSDLATPPGYKSAVFYLGPDTKKAPAGFNYATANDSLCDAIYDGLSKVNIGDNANVGDLFVCKLGYRKYSVIKITNIVTTTSDNNDYTEFEYKRYDIKYYQ